MLIAILILVSLCLVGNIVIATALLTLLASKPAVAPKPNGEDILNQLRQQLPLTLQRNQAPLAPVPTNQPGR